MTKLKDILLATPFADHVLTGADLHHLLTSTPAARYGLVNKALKRTELISIRRGLYLLATPYRQKKISKFYLASRIAAHSYISLESALSYHGWIPEQVTTVTSILARGRTRKFTTHFGEFVFYQLPVNEYEFLVGVSRVEEISGEPFFIASPLRALADYVYIKEIEWVGLEYLFSGLRIESERLTELTSRDFNEIKRVYRSQRVLHFLNQLEQEITP